MVDLNSTTNEPSKSTNDEKTNGIAQELLEEQQVLQDVIPLSCIHR
jgi:hypothetical protein